MGIAELKADAKIYLERIGTIEPAKLDLKTELKENIIPLFQSLFDYEEERDDEVALELADLAEAVDELIDQSDEILHPETSAKIVGVVELGKIVAAELDGLSNMITDDMRRRKLRAMIASYRQGAEIVIDMIQKMTLDPEEIEEGDEAAEAKPAAGSAGTPAKAAKAKARASGAVDERDESADESGDDDDEYEDDDEEDGDEDEDEDDDSDDAEEE